MPEHQSTEAFGSAIFRSEQQAHRNHAIAFDDPADNAPGEHRPERTVDARDRQTESPGFFKVQSDFELRRFRLGFDQHVGRARDAGDQSLRLEGFVDQTFEIVTV